MQNLLSAVTRHGIAYLDLVAGVAGEVRVAAKRRIALLAAAMVLSISGLVAGWASVVLMLWEQPTRNLIALLTALLLIAGSLVCAWLATSAAPQGPHRSRLKQELGRDRELIDDWRQTL